MLEPCGRRSAATCAGCFARGEDDFGHAGAQGAVVVELGEAYVFKGQVAQALQRFATSVRPSRTVVKQGSICARSISSIGSEGLQN